MRANDGRLRTPCARSRANSAGCWDCSRTNFLAKSASDPLSGAARLWVFLRAPHYSLGAACRQRQELIELLAAADGVRDVGDLGARRLVERPNTGVDGQRRKIDRQAEDGRDAFAYANRCLRPVSVHYSVQAIG
jgi:hypothetical protein